MMEQKTDKKATKRIGIIILIVSMIVVLFCMTLDVYRVTGHSMENTIMDGEYVVVRRRFQLRDSDIVVCDTKAIYLEDNYIVKRYDAEKSTVGLYLLAIMKTTVSTAETLGNCPSSPAVAWSWPLYQ